jgi:sugar phosphate isomerase/epimerase
VSTLSVQLYSVRDNFAADPADTLQRLAGIGFTNVEPYGVVENVATLRTGLPDNGLSAPTAHAGLIGADQPAVFAAAAELGIGLVIDPMVKTDKWQDRADIAATANALNAAAKLAAQHGLKIGYHNHWWELVSRIDGRAAFEVFADQLDPEVELEVDTYWATAGGENAPELLRRLGVRVKAIHVKDGGLNTDASGQVPAGQGTVPVAEVLAAAPNALRVIEFDAYDGDIFAGIAASYAFVTDAEKAGK